MTTKTFIVTVSNPGSGDKFFLDGVQQATVSLAYGATYRFDQSDSSNAGNTLRFSTTSDGTHGGGSAYIPGVTVVGTPGSSGAYTEFFVTEVGPPNTMFYYSVQNSGMGGTANLTSNSWGALGWNKGTWGDQGHIDEEVIGLSASFSIGEETITADASVSVTGIALTSSQGTTVGGTSVLIEDPGPVTMSSGIGSTVVGIGVPVTGTVFNTQIGAATVDESILTGEGWSRGAWGSFAWGVNYSVALTGQSLTSSIGEEVGLTDVTVAVTGSEITSTQGSFSLKIDQDIIVLAAEDQLDFTIDSLTINADANVTVSSAGSLTGSVGNTVAGLKTPVDVTGIQMSMTLGTFSLVQTTTESVTGLQGTLSLGQHAEIPGQIIGVSGLQATTSVGSVTANGTASIDVTGIQLTSSITSPNITAWAEIDLGVTNTWTPVDLAA